MEQQIELELSSGNWGTVGHKRFERWLATLPVGIRVLRTSSENDTRYTLYIYDQELKEQLAFIFILFEFNSIRMLRYLDDRYLSKGLNCANKDRVEEEDLTNVEEILAAFR